MDCWFAGVLISLAIVFAGGQVRLGLEELTEAIARRAVKKGGSNIFEASPEEVEVVQRAGRK